MLAVSTYHHGDLRQALLDRTVEVIGEKGVDGVSLRSLARDLGVSHAAPARHFATREELLNAVALAGVDALLQKARAAVAYADDDPFARLTAAANAHLEWALENAAHYRAVRNPEVSRGAEEAIAQRIGAFALVIRTEIARAQKEGWHADRPLRVEVFQFVSAITGAAVMLTSPIYPMTHGATDRDLYDGLLERLLS